LEVLSSAFMTIKVQALAGGGPRLKSQDKSKYVLSDQTRLDDLGGRQRQSGDDWRKGRGGPQQIAARHAAAEKDESVSTFRVSRNNHGPAIMTKVDIAKDGEEA